MYFQLIRLEAAGIHRDPVLIGFNTRTCNVKNLIALLFLHFPRPHKMLYGFVFPNLPFAG